METRIHLPEEEPPTAISEVLLALRQQKTQPKHEKKHWGDWIHFAGQQTVVSIESMRNLARSATIEGLDDEEELRDAILTAFRKLGWWGEDEDGPYPL